MILESLVNSLSLVSEANFFLPFEKERNFVSYSLFLSSSLSFYWSLFGCQENSVGNGKKKKYLFLLDFLSNQTDSVWEFSFLSVSEQPNRKPTIFYFILLELLKKIKTLVIQLVFNFFSPCFLGNICSFISSYTFCCLDNDEL